MFQTVGFDTLKFEDKAGLVALQLFKVNILLIILQCSNSKLYRHLSVGVRLIKGYPCDTRMSFITILGHALDKLFTDL